MSSLLLLLPPPSSLLSTELRRRRRGRSECYDCSKENGWAESAGEARRPTRVRALCPLRGERVGWSRRLIARTIKAGLELGRSCRTSLGQMTRAMSGGVAERSMRVGRSRREEKPVSCRRSHRDLI